MRATLLLGIRLGRLARPVGPVGFDVPMVLAFAYTVLWNRTHSIGLCVLRMPASPLGVKDPAIRPSPVPDGTGAWRGGVLEDRAALSFWARGIRIRMR